MNRALALDPGYASAYDKRCAVKIGMSAPRMPQRIATRP